MPTLLIQSRRVVSIYTSLRYGQIDYTLPTLGLSIRDYVGSIILMYYYFFQDPLKARHLAGKIAAILKESGKIKSCTDPDAAVLIASKVASLKMQTENDLDLAVDRFMELMCLKDPQTSRPGE